MNSRLATLFTLLLTCCLAAAPLAAEQSPSSDLLLPYFEVDLTGFELTTSFQVTNSLNRPVEARMAVHTNWGIPVIETQIQLRAEETRAFNLRDWVMLGELPDRALSADELAHVQAALTGLPSPLDDRFYGSEVGQDLAVGYVTIGTRGFERPDALWGSYFIIDPDGDAAQADVLANLDAGAECRDVCDRHSLFFLEGGDFDGGTELLVWTGVRGQPSEVARSIVDLPHLELDVFDMAGTHQETLEHDILAVQSVAVADLGLTEAVGKLNLGAFHTGVEQPMASFIAVRHRAENRFSVVLQSWCLPDPEGPQPPGNRPPQEPSIDLEKLTQGQDADTATGPVLEVGDPVSWLFVVTNTGNTTLVNVQVVDDDPAVTVSCPRTTLSAGATMTCTAHGTVQEGQYRNVGMVTARSPQQEMVSDADPSHYFGRISGGTTGPDEPAVVIEKATQGEDADTAPGPMLMSGETVTWTYVVVNTGDVALTSIVVTDDDPDVTVSCPVATLAPGASMTCTAMGIVTEGQYQNLGTVTAQGDGQTVMDTDPSHYLGQIAPPGMAAIRLEKSTNGQDADLPTGPVLNVGQNIVWTFAVTNVGDVPLVDVMVTDDVLGVVTCPKTTLAPGECIICTVTGLAEEGQHRNEGTATAGVDRDGDGESDGEQVSDDDPSHYLGVPDEPGMPGIDVEKSTNGQDADDPTGPVLMVGDMVAWTYLVTNTGDVELVSVVVTDDDPDVTVSCPKATLAAGESMTCTASGTAEEGQYANVGTATAEDELGTVVTATDPSHYFGEPMAPPVCGACEGKVTELVLRYTGSTTVDVRAIADHGMDDVVVFDDTVAPGETIELIGPVTGNPGFSGTLGTSVDIEIDGTFHASAHTSCSEEIGPGTVIGDFVVVSGESQQGGALCPVE